MESGDISVTDTVDATKGSVKIGRKIIEDFNGGEDRWLSIPEVLMHSSNIGSARIALKAGWQKQKAFFEKMQTYFEEKIVVAVEPLRNYYPAEEYHQDYYNKNPECLEACPLFKK